MCATPVAVDVGKRVTVVVGVVAEQTAVTGVDIEVPADFRLRSVRPTPGWTAGGTETDVELRGGPIPPFGCGYFTLEGTATERGVLAFPLVVHNDDGTTKRLAGREPGTAESAQLVYAGVTPGEDDGSVPVGTVVGAGLVGMGLAGAAVLFVRRRRARAGR